MKQISRTSGSSLGISAVPAQMNQLAESDIDEKEKQSHITVSPLSPQEADLNPVKEQQSKKIRIRLKQGFTYYGPSNIPINKPTHHGNSGNFQIQAQLQAQQQAYQAAQRAQEEAQRRAQQEAQRQAQLAAQRAQAEAERQAQLAAQRAQQEAQRQVQLQTQKQKDEKEWEEQWEKEKDKVYLVDGNKLREIATQRRLSTSPEWPEWERKWQEEEVAWKSFVKGEWDNLLQGFHKRNEEMNVSTTEAVNTENQWRQNQKAELNQKLNQLRTPKAQALQDRFNQFIEAERIRALNAKAEREIQEFEQNWEANKEKVYLINETWLRAMATRAGIITSPEWPEWEQNWQAEEANWKNLTKTEWSNQLKAFQKRDRELNFFTVEAVNTENQWRQTQKQELNQKLTQLRTQKIQTLKNRFDQIVDTEQLWKQVDLNTGEYHTYSTDITLKEPFPLEMRRHYLSQHLEKSALGYGWKMSGIPSLTLSSDGTTLITVEEADQTLLTYTQDPNNKNRWILETNPPLNNGNTDAFESFITKQTSETETHYTFHGTSGDKRTYNITNDGTSSERALLEKWEDKNGNNYTFQYGKDSQEPNYRQLIKILSSTGPHIDITYSRQGHITQIATEKESLQYTYNQEEDLIQITRTENNKTLQATYQYQQTKPTEQTEEILHSTHRLLQEKKPDGSTLENDYDSAGRLTAQKTTTGEPATLKSHTLFTYATEDNKNTIGSRTRSEYENGLLTKTTDPIGNKISYYYQDSGNPTLPTRIETKAQGETLFNLRNTYYPAETTGEIKTSGLLQKQQITEGAYAISEFSYNEQGLLSSQKEFTGTSDPEILTQFEYNTSGELTKQIDDLGISLYNHDSEKKQIRIERRDKAENLLTSQTLHYNDNAQLIQIEQLGSDAVSYKYDELGNLTEISSPKSDLIKLTYDERGQILNYATYNQTDESKISGENFTYEPGGKIASYVNPQGQETKYTYTSDGKLKRQENPDGTTQEWLYQLDGRIVKETLSDSTTWENTYNDTERTVTRIKKDAAHEILIQENYKFDRRGNITSYTDEKNQTTTRQYDNLNRLIAEIGSPAIAQAAPTENNPPAQTENSPTVESETSSAEPLKATPRKTHIAYSGNTATISNELGEKLILTKDALGRITSILNQDANNQKIYETTYTYSAEKNSVTETKGEESSTTLIDANKDPVNWTDLAGKLAKGFNTGWNRDATTSNSIAFNIGNYLGAFLADASDLFPVVGAIEATTGYRFLGHKELSPQQRITALASAGMSILPIAILTKAAGGAKVLVGVPNRTAGNIVKEMPVDFAKSLQGFGNYPGVDVFRNVTLRKDTLIYGGYPGQSPFYTTGSAIRRIDDSTSGLAQGLQIGRHPIHGCRPYITVYEVLENAPAAFGRALANPQHGVGRLPQLVVPNYQKVLRPIYDMPLNP